jgi:hypothetical protein
VSGLVDDFLRRRLPTTTSGSQALAAQPIANIKLAMA